MTDNIEFYQTKRGNTPILEYVSNLEARDAKKIDKELTRLNSYGIDILIKTKDAKRLSDCDLYELTPHSHRIFFYIKTKIYRMLHIYRKQSNKTPRKEIQKALSIKQEWEMRDKNIK